MKDIASKQNAAGQFRTPDRIWTGAERCFMPQQVSGAANSLAADTTVNITNAGSGTVELVLSFCPSSPGSGVSRVAAFQSVFSDVRLDLGQEATLYWLVSAWAEGQLAPNQASYLYTDNSDSFALKVTQNITVTHDSKGWVIPAYNSAEYIVNVGFGVQIQGWVYWGYSVVCSPQQSVVTNAGSYELARSNGVEQIGDPVVIQGTNVWAMPMGYGYLLAFDATGTGTVTRT
jgi:hypothetical protein